MPAYFIVRSWYSMTELSPELYSPIMGEYHDAMPVALLRGHGNVVVGGSVREVVFRAVYTEVNARLEADALRLGEGQVTFLNREEAAASTVTNRAQINRAWDLWKRDALAKMPTDLRDYTNATDAIEHALTRALSSESMKGSSSRVAAGADTGSALAANGPTSLPLPLVLLAAVSLVVLSAGGFGYVVRRRRSTD